MVTLSVKLLQSVGLVSQLGSHIYVFYNLLITWPIPGRSSGRPLQYTEKHGGTIPSRILAFTDLLIKQLMPCHCSGRSLLCTVELLPMPGRCCAEISDSRLTQVVGRTKTEQWLLAWEVVKLAYFTKIITVS